MLRKCLAARFTSSFKARLSNPFYSRPPFPSPWMIPDRSSPSRVRFAAWRPGALRADLERRAVHEGKGGGRAVWNRIREAYSDDIGLDLFFAGHGEEGTGNLVLKDGTLSPTRLLKLQADDVGGAGPRGRHPGLRSRLKGGWFPVAGPAARSPAGRRHRRPSQPVP